MSYSDLLRDPRWQRKRLEVMQRADFKCEECEDATTTLNVHHCFYVKGRKPWEYDTASLRCLCETCHLALTQDIATIQEAVSLMDYHARDRVVGFVRAATIGRHWEVYARCDDSTPAIGLYTDGMIEGAALELCLAFDEVADALNDARELTWHAYRDVWIKRSNVVHA